MGAARADISVDGILFQLFLGASQEHCTAWPGSKAHSRQGQGLGVWGQEQRQGLERQAAQGSSHLTSILFVCRGSHRCQHQYVLQCDSDWAWALGLPSAGRQGLQYAPHYLPGKCTLPTASFPKGWGILGRGYAHAHLSVSLSVCLPQGSWRAEPALFLV